MQLYKKKYFQYSEKRNKDYYIDKKINTLLTKIDINNEISKRKNVFFFMDF